MTTFLTRADEVGAEPYDSIAWAFEVHVKAPDTREFNAAILHGTEDAPERIEFFRSAMPRFDAAPDYTWTAED